MRPLKRCKTNDKANVLLIDLEEEDDDDVIVVDSHEFSHHKRKCSEHIENRRVSPQSVIRIEDDDDDESESYTNHLNVHREEGFTEFECYATSSYRSSFPYDNPHDARHGSYRFGKDGYEHEPIDIDSDSEVMEDLSGELRGQWERAASQRKVNRQKTNLGPEDLKTASGSNTRAVKKNTMSEHVSEGTSCSKANAPFGAEIPSTFNTANEETYVPYDHDTLFPEFDWRNLGVRSSFKNPVSSNTREAFKETSSKMFDEFFPESSPSLHTAGGVSFSSGGKDLKEQQCLETQEKNETCLEKNISESQSTHSQTDQAQCRADNERNASYIHGENFGTEYAECYCIFRSECVCGSRENFGGEKVQLEEQIPFFAPCEKKSNHNKASFDSTSGDAANNSSVDMDCEAYCENFFSKEADKELEKESSSETVVEQHSVSQSKRPLVEGGAKDAAESETNYLECGTKDVPEGGTNYVECKIGIDIINDKEKLKETEEYKRAMEVEWASRQQQLKLQAEEAQRLRKRKKAECLRVSNMEKRQKQRLEEVRESQKQDSANLNMKEQFRSEIIKVLKVLELRCFDMTSLLRSLGIQVEGSAHPTQQQMHAAYKRAVLKFHPDRSSGSNLKQQVEAEEKFKLITRMKEKYKLR